MLRVRSLKITFILQFAAVLLPVFGVLAYQIVSEGRRSAALDRQIRHHMLALQARDRYIAFGDGVMTGQLAPSALDHLDEAIARVREIARESDAPEVEDNAQILEHLRRVLTLDTNPATLRRLARPVTDMRQRLARLHEMQARDLDERVRASTHEAQAATHIIAAVALAVALLTLGIILRIIRYLTQPLGVAVSVADRIADGKPVEDAEFQRPRDIGNLLRSLRRMYLSLRRYQSEAEAYQKGLHEKISALARSEASLEQAQRLARIGNWSWHPHSGAMFWSGEMYRLLGLEPGQCAPTLDNLLLHWPAGESATLAEGIREIAAAPGAFARECLTRHTDGVQRVVFVQGSSETGESGAVKAVHGTLQDITERRQAEEKIRRLAHYDSLTGLPNRRHFREQLERGIEWARANNGRLAAVFVDLDRFKRINDTLGHEAGDELLKEISCRLGRCVRGADYVSRDDSRTPRHADRRGEVARLGGDEFIIMLAGLDDPQGAATVARRILAELARPVLTGGHELTVTCSIGIAVYPDDGTSADVLLKNADAAMYQAKELGKNTWQFFRQELNSQAYRKLTLETELRHAIERDQLLLYYQPKVDGKNGRIAGAEALIRWQHPEWGLVPPAQFIPLAEETGLIVPIGDWVMQTASRQLGAWHRAGHAQLGLAINLAAPSFQQAGLVERVAELLRTHAAPPGKFTIEVTESLLIKDAGAAVSTLTRLRELGVRISMDDFGTGYSSLSYLRRLPIDQLKIDRSFIKDITEDADDAAIAAAIIALAHSLRLEVVAEGVETLAQAQLLATRGCRMMQGYYFSRPVAADEFTRMLAQDSQHADERRVSLSDFPAIRAA